MKPLAPRLRRVLPLLLAGDSKKQIALKLGISSYTVSEYTKQIYKHFDVTNRGALLSKFVGSNHNALEKS